MSVCFWSFQLGTEKLTYLEEKVNITVIFFLNKMALLKSCLLKRQFSLVKQKTVWLVLFSYSKFKDIIKI